MNPSIPSLAACLVLFARMTLGQADTVVRLRVAGSLRTVMGSMRSAAVRTGCAEPLSASSLISIARASPMRPAESWSSP